MRGARGADAEPNLEERQPEQKDRAVDLEEPGVSLRADWADFWEHARHPLPAVSLLV